MLVRCLRVCVACVALSDDWCCLALRLLDILCWTNPFARCVFVVLPRAFHAALCAHVVDCCAARARFPLCFVFIYGVVVVVVVVATCVRAC